MNSEFFSENLFYEGIGKVNEEIEKEDEFNDQSEISNQKKLNNN